MRFPLSAMLSPEFLPASEVKCVGGLDGECIVVLNENVGDDDHIALDVDTVLTATAVQLKADHGFPSVWQ